MRTQSKIQITILTLAIMVVIPFASYAADGKIQIGQTSSTTFPITISQSGSYILTSNLTVTSGADGIRIEADNVTLDLNGFALIDNSGSSLFGIVSNDNVSITILNGKVKDFGLAGISVHGKNNILKDLSASGSYFGISTSYATITNCQVNSNQSGFEAIYSNITNCGADSNNMDGIFAQNSTLNNCTASNNGYSGFNIYQSSLTNCIAESNFDGFLVDTSTLTNCSSNRNTSDGFSVSRSTVTNCNAYLNDNGFRVSYSNVTNCNAYGNTDCGISTSDSRIEGNDASNNQYGINAHSTSKNNYIVRNTARDNTAGNFRDAGTNNYMPLTGDNSNNGW